MTHTINNFFEHSGMKYKRISFDIIRCSFLNKTQKTHNLAIMYVTKTIPELKNKKVRTNLPFLGLIKAGMDRHIW